MYRWVEHTAELELAISAPTEEAVFEDALHAFAELVSDDGGGDRAVHEIVVRAADPASLLAEWIGELVYLAETRDFIPERTTAIVLRDGGLRATVEGRRGRPSPIVKSVTYHRLALGENGSCWRARVVLDV